MKKLLGFLALSFGLFAGYANADLSKAYYGIGFTDGKVKLINEGDKSLGTISATAGFQVLDMIGLELQVGAASDQTSSILSEPLVQYQAALIRFGYRWNRAGVYVLGGQARLDMSNRVKTTDAGLAFGLGLNFFGSETTSLNLHVLDIDDGAFTTVSIGFQYYFGGY